MLVLRQIFAITFLMQTKNNYTKKAAPTQTFDSVASKHFWNRPTKYELICYKGIAILSILHAQLIVYAMTAMAAACLLTQHTAEQSQLFCKYVEI